MFGVSDLVQAFAYVRRQQGWRSALNQAVQFALLSFFEYHTGFVLSKSLEEPIRIPAPDVPLTIRQATLQDLPLLATIVPPLRVKRFARKMAAGEICFVAIHRQKVIAYVWAGLAGTPSTEDVRLELDAKEAYVWAGYAAPRFRRQGVVRAVNLCLCRALQEEGYERIVLLVDRGNRPSLGHCHKMGYRITDGVTHLRVLRWRVNRYAPIEEPLTKQ